MGGGASRVNAARRSQDEADKLFDSMDESGHGELTFSQILSMIKKIPGKLDCEYVRTNPRHAARLPVLSPSGAWSVRHACGQISPTR
jgi:hypothetical protein